MDGSLELVRFYEYREDGRLLATEDLWDGEPDAFTQYEYDDAARTVTQWTGLTEDDPNPYYVRTFYDELWRPLRMEQTNGEDFVWMWECA